MLGAFEYCWARHIVNSSQQTHSTDIVVVDDDELLLELVSRLVRKTDYRLCLFSDESEALEFLREHSTNVLFVDHRMPRIDGLELLALLADQGNLSARQVYLCSAVELPESVCESAARLGAEAISKDVFSDRIAFLASLEAAELSPSGGRHDAS